MNYIDLAMPLVALFEGCEKKRGGLIYPYLDTLAKPHVWTRGYGRTYGITADSPGITPDEARIELAAGLAAYGDRVAGHSPGLRARPACHAAITSWAWNCGTGAYKVSRLRKAIDAERWDDAAELILRPNTAGGVVLRGLMRRRLAEQEMFRTGI
jgi:lysozyme